VRGLLRGFGFRVPRVLRVRWAQSVRDALAGNPTLLAIIDPFLAAGAALRGKHAVSTAGALFRRPERRSVSSRSFVGDDLAQVVDALE